MDSQNMINQLILRIENPIECEIIERINRFVVEVQVGKQKYRASINNTGRLRQFLVKGKKCYCIKHNKLGKTDFRLFAIGNEEHAAIIDTRLQMQTFERVLEIQILPWLEGYTIVKRDAQLGNSRIDYLLESNGEHLYLEAKSAVLRDGNYAMYPDCPTTRGRKHISELTEYVHNGGRAIVFFIAALPQINAFKPYRDGDAELCNLLQLADVAGVEIRSMGLAYDPSQSAIILYDPDLHIKLN
jgi:sugar fermentation stimulation protein A